MNVLVVGAGMYVCGRGTAEYGTILPAVTEWIRSGGRGAVCVASTTPRSSAEVRQRASELAARTAVPLELRAVPESQSSDMSYVEALETLPRPACAIVAVPDDLHHAVASRTLSAGLPTLVVKPLAPTLGESLDLMQRAAQTNTYGAVEFHKRWDRANRRLRDAIDSGSLGRPLAFHVQYSQRRSVPLERFRSWAARTNVFQYLGVHYVDIISFATGASPIAAAALGQKHLLAAAGVDTYDAIEALVEWQTDDGHRFGSVFVTSWVDPESTTAMSDQRIMVIGTQGRFESDQKRRGIELNTVSRGVDQPNPDFCAAYREPGGAVRYEGYGIDSVVQFLRDADALTAGRIEARDLEGRRPTFRSALPSIQVVEAVNESLSHGGSRVAIAPLAIPA